MTPAIWCYLKEWRAFGVAILILLLFSGLIIASMSVLYLGSRVTDLPLPHAVMDSTAKPSKGLAVVFSGPTGWIDFEQDLAEALSAAQFDVRGVDYLRYFFWKKRTPVQLAEALSGLIREWIAERGTQGPVILVGYAKGADVLPFATNLLEPDLKAQVQLVTLISVSRLADFRLRLSEVLKGGFGPFALKVGPEIKKLESVPGLCIYGHQDRVSLCRNLKGISNTMEVREVPSGRIFHDAQKVSELILSKFEKEIAKSMGVETKAKEPTNGSPLQEAKPPVSRKAKNSEKPLQAPALKSEMHEGHP